MSGVDAPCIFLVQPIQEVGRGGCPHLRLPAHHHSSSSLDWKRKWVQAERKCGGKGWWAGKISMSSPQTCSLFTQGVGAEPGWPGLGQQKSAGDTFHCIEISEADL